MYEYECLGCGKKYYFSVEYKNLINKFCDECGDYIFYTVEELKEHFDNEEWLKEQYSELEKIVKGDKNGN